MEATEEWLPVNDYENYEVSSLGQVRNQKTKRILKAGSNGGYLTVGLRQDGSSKSCSVHRLVALAFIENPENKAQVNHKDKVRSNNTVSNL